MELKQTKRDVLEKGKKKKEKYDEKNGKELRFFKEKEEEGRGRQGDTYGTSQILPV